LGVLRVNRWWNVIILLVCTEGEKKDVCDDAALCTEGEDMEECDDTAFVY